MRRIGVRGFSGKKPTWGFFLYGGRGGGEDEEEGAWDRGGT